MRLRRHYQTRLIIFVLLGTALLVLFLFWANTPQQGKINYTTPTKALNKPGDKLLDGKYIQFVYGGNYSLKKDQALNGDLERYTLSAYTRYDKRILAYVTKLSDGRLDQYGAYIYRQSNPGYYSMRKLQTDSGLLNIWVRNDGTEQTVMIPQGNSVAVITIVTANPKDDLTTEMNALLNSFRWK